MDPLERAKYVLSRAANACAAAEEILPARSKLARDVSAAAAELSSLRAAAQSLTAELAAEEARGASAASAARRARARLRQLAAAASEQLAFAGEEAPPLPPPSPGEEEGPIDVRALQAALEAWALKRLVARGVVERVGGAGGGASPV